jgi:hypothetical protein
MFLDLFTSVHILNCIHFRERVEEGRVVYPRILCPKLDLILSNAVCKHTILLCNYTP